MKFSTHLRMLVNYIVLQSRTKSEVRKYDNFRYMVYFLLMIPPPPLFTILDNLVSNTSILYSKYVFE